MPNSRRAADDGQRRATGRLDTITDRFFLLARFPYMGRDRDEDFGVGARSFAVGEYVIVYGVEGEDILVLRVAHGSRDIDTVFPR